MTEKTALIEMTADIVSAYVGSGGLLPNDLPALIQQVHKALSDVATGAPGEESTRLVPAVSIKKSITPDYLICLEDGRKLKSMKRHLRQAFDLTPNEYRAKWGLPVDYPMVAPSYSAQRSALAKQLGLGQGVRKPTSAPKKGPAKTGARKSK